MKLISYEHETNILIYFRQTDRLFPLLLLSMHCDKTFTLNIDHTRSIILPVLVTDILHLHPLKLKILHWNNPRPINKTNVQVYGIWCFYLASSKVKIQERWIRDLEVVFCFQHLTSWAYRSILEIFVVPKIYIFHVSFDVYKIYT